MSIKYTVDQIMANEWSVKNEPREDNPVAIIDMGADLVDAVRFEYVEMFDDWEYTGGYDGIEKARLVYDVMNHPGFYEKFYALFGIEV